MIWSENVTVKSYNSCSIQVGVRKLMSERLSLDDILMKFLQTSAAHFWNTVVPFLKIVNISGAYLCFCKFLVPELSFMVLSMIYIHVFQMQLGILNMYHLCCDNYFLRLTNINCATIMLML